MARDSNNKPSHRIIAKQTDARNDRFENIGVAWRKVTDGREVISLRFNRFLNGAALTTAESVLLVPNEDDRPKRGREPGDDYDPGPSDDDFGH